MIGVATYGYPPAPPTALVIDGFRVPRQFALSGYGLGSDLSTGSGQAANFLNTVAPFTGPAAPFVAAAGAVASLVSQVSAMFQGCGPTCVQTSNAANQAGAIATQIRDNYLAQPVHYASLQQIAVNGIQQIFAQLQQVCSNPAMGAAGERCISERLVKGGTAPWCPTTTGCDWITVILDPVLNDPNVVPDPTTESSVVSSLTSSGFAVPLLVAALIAGVLLI